VTAQPRPSARVAGAVDRDLVLDIVVDAFFDDPLASWVFEERERRQEGLRAFYGPQVHRFPDTGVMLVAPGGEAASIWFAPAPDDGLAAVYDGFADMLVDVLGEETAHRKLAGLAQIGAGHPSTPHWYLATVGTRSAAQGQGWGPTVITPVLDRADAAGVPAYLESSNPRNVPFYERLGFTVTGTVQMPEDGPVVTFMLRPPA
jgi:ribosomal protein S18 acetylase RimI-like enzyme